VKSATGIRLRLAPLAAVAAVWTTATGAPSSQNPLYREPARSFEERAADLVSRMTLEEKVAQLQNDAPAIARLGVPAYEWWNEALHGVARAGPATVFPQAIGLAATFDPKLMAEEATAISDEARAKYEAALRRDSHGRYQGLTFWSPNINIFRDPRWGRGQETYGEDPYLTARMGVEFVKGMQGTDPHYLKVVATAKHYAVHSGPEPERHRFDVHPSEIDLHETYLPAFRALVEEAHVASVMGAYNRVNGESASASPRLLQQILRMQWGFKGYVVSDCDAVDDIFTQHKIVASAAEAAALALRSGLDLNCGKTYAALVEAVHKGLATEAEVDTALRRLMQARFELGMFDPPERVPWTGIPYSVNQSPQHDRLEGSATVAHSALHRSRRSDGRRGHVPAGQLLRHAGCPGDRVGGNSRCREPQHEGALRARHRSGRGTRGCARSARDRVCVSAPRRRQHGPGPEGRILSRPGLRRRAEPDSGRFARRFQVGSRIADR
jgi:beta-glucosidase